MTPKSSALIFGGITLVAIASGIGFAMLQPTAQAPIATATATQTAAKPSPATSPASPPASSPAAGSPSTTATPLAPESSAPGSPAPESPAPPIREVQSCVVKVATVDDPEPPLNVRSAPTAESAKVGQLQNGTYVSVTQEQDGWFKISDPVTGWVNKSRTKNGCNEKVERVSFSKGETSIALSDQFVGTGYHRYLLNAGKGQSLTIRVQEGPLPFVLAPNGKIMMEPYDDSKPRWSAILPATGDYTIQLDSNYKGYAYAFVVEIK